MLYASNKKYLFVFFTYVMHAPLLGMMRTLAQLPVASRETNKFVAIKFHNRDMNVHIRVASGSTALHRAVCTGRRHAPVLLIRSLSTWISGPRYRNTSNDEEGVFLLHQAAQEGNREIVELLIAEGADINAVAQNDFTPLHCASTQGHREIVGVLLALGADLKVVDNSGQTPLHAVMIATNSFVLGMQEIAKEADQERARASELENVRKMVPVSANAKWITNGTLLHWAAACMHLGTNLLVGEGSVRDYEEFRIALEKAVEQSENREASAEACIGLGLIYCEGLGVETDFAKARAYFEQCADQVLDSQIIEMARFSLAKIYFKGLGGEQNLAKARERLEQVAGQTRDKKLQARAWLGLGEVYDYGQGKDAARACAYYELAANQIDCLETQAQACFSLGITYENGLGVEEDCVKARGYYELLANQTHYSHYLRMQAWARNALGNFYFFGYGIEINYVKAREYCELAANQMDVVDRMDAQKPLQLEQVKIGRMAQMDSCLLLGMIFQSGWGIEKDYVKARKYYERAAALQDPNEYIPLEAAWNSLGDMYHEGLGVERDNVKARTYYNLLLHQSPDNEFREIARRKLNLLDAEGGTPWCTLL